MALVGKRIFETDLWRGISRPASFYPVNLLHYWRTAAIGINSNNKQNSVLFCFVC